MSLRERWNSARTRWNEFMAGMRPRVAEWRFMLKRIRQSTLAMVGLIIILVFIGIMVFAPVLAPPHGADPFKIPQDADLLNLQGARPTPPTVSHIFGTMDQNYDIYYACIWGTITAFRIGVVVVAVSLIMGLLIGTVAGFYGGLLDEALMRFTDIIIAFPGLILAMALVLAFPGEIGIGLSSVVLAVAVIFMLVALAFKPDRRLLAVIMLVVIVSLLSTLYWPFTLSLSLTNLDKILIAITLVGWPGYARVIRGEVMRVRNEDYIEASKASGSSDFGVMWKHILPNSIYPLLIVATLDIGSIVLTAAALSFIGIGAPQDYADWGQVISRAQPWMSTAGNMIQYFHTFFIPGLFIAFFVVGWNLLGDALRDVLDPMLRRR